MLHETHHRCAQCLSVVNSWHDEQSTHKSVPCWLAACDDRVVNLAEWHLWIRFLYNGFDENYFEIHSVPNICVAKQLPSVFVLTHSFLPYSFFGFFSFAYDSFLCCCLFRTNAKIKQTNQNSASFSRRVLFLHQNALLVKVCYRLSLYFVFAWPFVDMQISRK